MNPYPTEDQEQATLFQWAAMQERKWPELRLLYAIPNGGKRSKPTAANMKRTGVKKGVPDICLPVARGKYHGLYIELKRIKGSHIQREQVQWISALEKQGYRAMICKGWTEGRKAIEEYLTAEKIR